MVWGVCHSLQVSIYSQVASAKAKLEKSLSGDAFPLNYSTSLRVIRDALAAVSPAPVVISEGANTMDNARYPLTPRSPPLCPFPHAQNYPPPPPPRARKLVCAVLCCALVCAKGTGLMSSGSPFV